MKRKARISLMIVMLMILSSFTALTVSSDTTPDDGAGIVTFEKTIWNKEAQGWVPSLHGVVIGDTVHFKLTITYAVAGYDEGVKLSLKKINIFDNLPYGLEYVDGSSTVDCTSIVPKISGNTLHWNLTDASYNLDEGENHSIEFNALVVYSENAVYTKPETKMDNYAYATAWECGHIYYHGENELNDYANVYVKNKIEVKKEVWSGNEWVDSVDNVILGQILTFKITITYYGPYVLDNMTVTDHLPSCLTYADNAIITGAENVIPTVGDGKVTWYWAKDLNLGNGGTVTITFDTKVVKYCEKDGEEVNSVYVRAVSFCHEVYWGYAEIPISCIPHDPIFEKKVWNVGVWDEKTSVYVNDTVKFKIELTYYGIDNLTDIEIMDKLPCVLEHVDENATLTVFHNNTGHTTSIAADVSKNKKIAWWNLTGELEDGDTLSIVFNALVTGATGDCDECSGINTASYTAYSTGNDYSGNDTAKIHSTYRPPVPPIEIDIIIKGLSLGRIRGSINNLGDADLTNAKCNILVSGGILKRMNLNVTETFEKIKAGGAASIDTGRGSIKHGFGRITVTVTVIVGEETFKENFEGFVLGRLVRLKPAA